MHQAFAPGRCCAAKNPVDKFQPIHGRRFRSSQIIEFASFDAANKGVPFPGGVAENRAAGFVRVS